MAVTKKPAKKTPVTRAPVHVAAPQHALGAKTVEAPRAAPHRVEQPPGLHSPALNYSGGHYVLPRPAAHHVAWNMDQAPWMSFEDDRMPIGTPVAPS